ncbi:hypothetical protein ACTFIU_009661 [Dictyostelium citrinum]
MKNIHILVVQDYESLKKNKNKNKKEEKEEEQPLQVEEHDHIVGYETEEDEMNSSSDEDSLNNDDDYQVPSELSEEYESLSSINYSICYYYLGFLHIFTVKHITSYPHNGNNIQKILSPSNNFISNHNQNDNNNNSIGQATIVSIAITAATATIIINNSSSSGNSNNSNSSNNNNNKDWNKIYDTIGHNEKDDINNRTDIQQLVKIF